MRRRHRGAGNRQVLVGLAARPPRGHDVVGGGPVVGTARCGDGPVVGRQGARVGSHGAARARSSGNDGVQAPEGGVAAPQHPAEEPAAQESPAVVAGGEDGDRPMRPGVLDAGRHRGRDAAARSQVERQRTAVAEAQVDDLGAMVDDPHDARLHVGVGAGAVGVQRLGDDELGAGRDTGDALAVVLHGGDDAGHMGAVAVVVLPGARAPGRIGVGPDAVGAHQDLACQVFVVEIDAGVDDSHADAGSGAAVPSRGGTDLGETPLLRIEWVVRGKCRAGKSHGEGTSHHDRARRPSATWPEPSRRAHRRPTARDINGACFATHTTPCLDLLRVDELYERFPKATN